MKNYEDDALVRMKSLSPAHLRLGIIAEGDAAYSELLKPGVGDPEHVRYAAFNRYFAVDGQRSCGERFDDWLELLDWEHQHGPLGRSIALKVLGRGGMTDVQRAAVASRPWARHHDVEGMLLASEVMDTSGGEMQLHHAERLIELEQWLLLVGFIQGGRISHEVVSWLVRRTFLPRRVRKAMSKLLVDDANNNYAGELQVGQVEDLCSLESWVEVERFVRTGRISREAREWLVGRPSLPPRLASALVASRGAS